MVVEPGRPRIGARSCWARRCTWHGPCGGAVVAIGPEPGRRPVELASVGRGRRRVHRGHGRRGGRGRRAGPVVRGTLAVGRAGPGHAVGRARWHRADGGAPRGGAHRRRRGVRRRGRPAGGVEARLRRRPGGRHPCRSGVQMATVRPGVLPLPGPARRRAPVPVDTVEGATAGGCGSSTSGPRRRRRGPPGGADSRDGGPGRRPRGVRGARPAAEGARRRAGRHAQGDRQGMAAPGPPDRHHRAQRGPGPVRRHRRVGEVQPHRRRARGAGTIVAINNDPDGPRSSNGPTSPSSADWHEVVPLLVDALG